MTNAQTNTVYPDTTFEKVARATGERMSVLWEEKGPRNTQIAWMVCYLVKSTPVIVQTYKDGGWEVFSPQPSRNTADAIADALNRCEV